MFWDLYLRLCTKKGMSANAVAKELGITSGTVSGWKQGRVPYNSTKIKITQYFGVEPDYFEKDHNPSSSSNYTYAAYDELTRELSPDQIKQLEAYADFLRSQK